MNQICHKAGGHVYFLVGRIVLGLGLFNFVGFLPFDGFIVFGDFDLVGPRVRLGFRLGTRDD